jgi:hypothetical protein
MPFTEHRLAPRISAEALPAHYRRYAIRVTPNLVDEVLAYDSSVTGFSFVSNLPQKDFRIGSEVVAFPIGSEWPVKGLVKYAASVPNGTHVGLSLKLTDEFNAYRDVISSMFEDVGNGAVAR